MKITIKKTIISTFWTLFIFAIAFFAGRDLAICSQSGNYTRDAIVISKTHDAVYVEDVTGNYWSFDLSDNYQIGDCIQMVMSDNRTKDITDDEIIDIVKIK